MRLPFFFLVLLPALVHSCEEGWTLFEKKCYKTFSEPSIKNANANDFCKKHGANLTSVLTESERRFLVDFTTTGTRIKVEYQPIIGGYRESLMHPFKWYDGNPFTQMQFFSYPTEPTNRPGEFYMSFTGDMSPMGFPSASLLDQPLSPAYLFVCKKDDTGNHKTVCEDRWASFGSNCYRRFSNPQLKGCTNINQFCANYGSTLASVLNEEERLFVIDYMRNGHSKADGLQPIIGAFRSSVSSPWQWFDGTPFTQHHMLLAPNKNLCMGLRADQPENKVPQGYFFDFNINANGYLFVCKKKGVLKCDTTSMTSQDGKCICKKDYIDIVDSNAPEAKNYTRGQKCVKRGKCYDVKDTTSILFIIDSSESITTKFWPKMVDFVKSGAHQLPNSFRVGFIKYSNEISDKKWLEPKWSSKEYKNAVPDKYDNGQTNTPLALREARKMFKKDENMNKVAVLITDGMPVSAEYETQEEALNATRKAARELQKDGVRLTVMGVGPEIHTGITQVEEWLKNPRKDYFSFTQTVDCLKDDDMDKLLLIVCD